MARRIKHRIDSSTIADGKTLFVRDTGVEFVGAVAFGSNKFPFDTIDFVYASPSTPQDGGKKPVIAFQVGREVFSLPYNPKNQKHLDAVAALLEGVNRAKSIW